MTFSRNNYYHFCHNLFIFTQAVAFAISQAVLYNALPQGVQLFAEPHCGSLLKPSIYRDAQISCMYLLEDIEDMLVLTLDVPPFQQPSAAAAAADNLMATPMGSPMGSGKGPNNFKPERKSDFGTGAYESSIKKVRKTPEYPIAKERLRMMEADNIDEASKYIHGKNTLYIIRCLQANCSISSLFTGLNYFPSNVINEMLRIDLKYPGDDVVSKNKANLLIVCEHFLHEFDTRAIA
jgi:hypothetical protein